MALKRSLGIMVEAFSERYLGLPTAVGRITSGTFDHIDGRIRGKMNGWSEKNLACAGREVLLKTVIQAIPTYSMSCFKLTKKVCKNITSCMAKYWWGSSLDKRALHWLSWDKLAAPKCKGGMGFRNFEAFNLAMLGKHGWRLLTHPNSLCGRVLKGKYFNNSNFLQATVPRGASSTWRAIVAGRSALDTGLITRVVNGSSVSIWTDKWIPGTSSFTPVARLGTDPLEKVSDLIDQYTGKWKVDIIRQNFLAPDADAILNIPLRASGGEDFLAWALEKNRYLLCKICISRSNNSQRASSFRGRAEYGSFIIK